jgi:probable phosphoglycerate mutase
VTCIVLVRHGETEWNREERYRGRIDVDLDDTGRAQAEACARRIAAAWQPVAVYASPLVRAVHTAQPIAALCGLAVETIPDLVDIDYGDWHGLTAAEAAARWPDLAEAWERSPGSAAPPRGEPVRALQRRAVAALERLGEGHPSGTVVAVSHTAFNRAAILGALGGPLDAFHRVGQSNGAINVIDVANRRFVVWSVNDTCHLAETHTAAIRASRPCCARTT